MLAAQDFDDFLSLYKSAMSDEMGSVEPPDALSCADGRLTAQHLWRLSRAYDIAHQLGEAPAEVAHCARALSRSMADDRYADFTATVPWQNAIRWAVQRLPEMEDRSVLRGGLARQSMVAIATARLRRKGHAIPLASYGPNVSIQTVQNIGRGLDALAQLLGGQYVINEVFSALARSNRLYDGIWLFGDCVPNVVGSKSPSMPWAYLISLGLKHAGLKGIARKPEVAWETLKQDATDLAAVLDCERYSQFDGMSLDASEFIPSILESLTWRETFTLPQVPDIVLPVLVEAFSAVLRAKGQDTLSSELGGYFSEIKQLERLTAKETASRLPSRLVESDFPLLLKAASAAPGQVNRGYLSPLDANKRTQDRTIFFGTKAGDYLVLNHSFIAAAACEVIFGKLFASGLKSGLISEIQGALFEQSIAIACRRKGLTPQCNVSYSILGENFEVDVAAQVPGEFILFETKAKMLTRDARGLNVAAFLSDYASSYLALAKQLLRHEAHLRAGHIPQLQFPGGETRTHVTKVAVSPLSYGPVNDKVLSINLVRAMAGLQLSTALEDGQTKKGVAAYNSEKAEVLSWIEHLHEGRAEEIEVQEFLYNLFWLDLGQLIYAIDRATTISSAVSPLRHMTFSTRDFWTEIAQSDRSGLLRGKWRPVNDAS